MTAEERMRERAAQVCNARVAAIFDLSRYGCGATNEAIHLAKAIRALPLEGEPQGEPAKDQRAERVKADARSVSQDDPASAHHSRTEQAQDDTADGSDAASQGRYKPAPAREPNTSAVEEVRDAAENTFPHALEVAQRHAEELDRLRAENADLRREREGMVPVSKKLMDSAISTLQEHGEHAIALNLWAALIAAKDKP